MFSPIKGNLFTIYNIFSECLKMFSKEKCVLKNITYLNSKKKIFKKRA